MRTVRQLASGLVYAFVSLLLVIGGISLSLAQGGLPASSTDTFGATSTSTIVQLRDSQPTQTRVPVTPLATLTQASTLTPAATTAPTTSTTTNTAAVATSRPLPTSTRACGPYSGWIRSYVVQPGDTLFRIAIMHGITVESLQRANCKTGTVIYSGERLWVPFILPPATELTIIPTFDTPTSEITATTSSTPIQTTAP